MASVGYTGVVNQANTSSGFADGIGAVNVPAAGYGEDVGDGGVVDLYNLIPPVPPVSYSILMEDSGFVFQEDDSKIKLEIS